ncbi:hypothetical protein [Devosia lacusdianchii]|uniref:hypothetical protein n=1 Tax=Devosia lacusdianchii TaxID=2917991 RepID=UPI001F05CC90|nr:hypothetical protein [Devosia sp. JXJ CY 41]
MSSLAINFQRLTSVADDIWTFDVTPNFAVQYQKHRDKQVLLFEDNGACRVVGVATLSRFVDGLAVYLTDVRKLDRPLPLPARPEGAVWVNLSKRAAELLMQQVLGNLSAPVAYERTPIEPPIPEALSRQAIDRMVGRCQLTWLNEKTENNKDVSVVLVRPVADGGRHDINNCLVLCKMIAGYFASFSISVGQNRGILMDVPTTRGIVGLLNPNGRLWMPDGVSDTMFASNFKWHSDSFAVRRGWI